MARAAPSASGGASPQPRTQGGGADHGDRPAAGAGSPRGAGRQRAGKGQGTGPAKGGNAAGAAGAGLGGYQQRLAAWLGRQQRYPQQARARGQQGTVKVRFTLDQNGRLLSRQITQSSGHPLLDAEALAMLQRAAPLPRPPPGTAPVTVTVPIRFALR